MASFQQTPQGAWRVQIDCRGQRRSKTLSTRSAAEKWAETIEGRLRAKHEHELAAAHTMLATLVPKRMLAAMAAIPHTQREILEAAVPARSLSGVYFLIHKDEVVYVGQSVDVLSRISRHRREGREFDSYSYMVCEPERMNELEALYITALMPWLNLSLGRVQA
jgi:hypothetical protein